MSILEGKPSVIDKDDILNIKNDVSYRLFSSTLNYVEEVPFYF